MVRGLLLLSLVASCKLSSDAVEPPADATPPPDAPLPVELPAYEPATLIGELSADMSGDDDASLTADRLLVIFNSNRGGNADLFASTRPSVDDPWDPPLPVDELNSAMNESTVALSSDGLAILLASNRINGDQDVFLSTRPTRTAMWSPPAPIDELNSTAGDFASYLSPDRLTVILHSDRAGDFDLYVATRETEADPFSEPTLISGVNAAGFDDDSGRFAAGELVLTFHSNRTGGNPDLYAATRATTDDPFGAPEPVADLNTDEREQDLWLTEDLCYAMFSRVEAGEESFYEATCVP